MSFFVPPNFDTGCLVIEKQLFLTFREEWLVLQRKKEKMIVVKAVTLYKNTVFVKQSLRI